MKETIDEKKYNYLKKSQECLKREIKHKQDCINGSIGGIVGGSIASIIGGKNVIPTLSNYFNLISTNESTYLDIMISDKIAGIYLCLFLSGITTLGSSIALYSRGKSGLKARIKTLDCVREEIEEFEGKEQVVEEDIMEKTSETIEKLANCEPIVEKRYRKY